MFWFQSRQTWAQDTSDRESVYAKTWKRISGSCVAWFIAASPVRTLAMQVKWKLCGSHVMSFGILAEFKPRRTQRFVVRKGSSSTHTSTRREKNHGSTF
jgi:hypothetical protein